MDDDSPDDPDRMTHPVARHTEHRQRNEEQVELLRRASARRRHASYIEEALRRAGREGEADESNGSTGC
jgi:hypothetical protein